MSLAITLLSVALMLVLIGLLALVVLFFVQKDQRRKKVVDSRLQLLIAVEIILHSLLLPILLAIVLFVPPFVQLLSNAPGHSTEEKIIYHQQILKTLFLFNYTKWPMAIVILIFIGLVSIIFSHHIVGPLTKLRSHLKQILARDLTPKLHFREGDIDILQDVQTQFNQVIEDFSGTLASLRKEITTVRAHKNEPGKIEASLSKMQELVELYQVEKAPGG